MQYRSFASDHSSPAALSVASRRTIYIQQVQLAHDRAGPSDEHLNGSLRTSHHSVHLPPFRPNNHLARFLIIGILVLGGGPQAGAQQESKTKNIERQARSLQVDGQPTLDGNVLSDPFWNPVSAITGFVQSAPDEGTPATERTEVRIAFSTDTLFVGVVCYDRDPTAIVVNDSSRDSSMNEADSFQMVLDTFHDKQNGLIFGTTPAGQEYDGQVINEGSSRSLFGSGGRGGFSRGSGGGFNLNWDGAWQVRTLVSEVGWSAEFPIPFRTIRYPDRSPQRWGINFQRVIRRRNETAYWAPLPRQYNLYRISMAGDLVGLSPPTGFVNTLQLTPYATGELVARNATTPELSSLADTEFGTDLKYGVTSGRTLDATYNTDFAQVEVDSQQVNLDRFNLFSPENRPFFLENADAFAVSNQDSARSPDLGQTDLFFTRWVGISKTGEQIPILAVRVSPEKSQTP